MDNQIRAGGFNILPTVVKNLLIINGLLFVAKIVLSSTINLDAVLGLHYFAATDFHVWQIVTYMFMHGDFGHLFFNMFALWMFGSAIENIWGTKRFLIYYLVTGVGAALIHYFVIAFQIHSSIMLINQFLDAPTLESFGRLTDVAHINEEAIRQNLAILQNHPEMITEFIPQIESFKASFLNSFNIIGASGSVFGLLLAFGMMFPNSEIYVYFLLPIKAKWFVMLYGVSELLYGVFGSADGVAHFAHLGGMLFGFLLIMAWKRYDMGVSVFNDRQYRQRKKRFKYTTSYDNRPARYMTDEEYNARKAEDEKRIDEILDKISESGYDSLTREEKDFLFKVSNKR